MNKTREHLAYLDRGGKLSFKQWYTTGAELATQQELLDNWLDSNPGRAVMDYPMYSQIAALERKLVL